MIQLIILYHKMKITKLSIIKIKIKIKIKIHVEVGE
jgi:hypothetical protein